MALDPFIGLGEACHRVETAHRAWTLLGERDTANSTAALDITPDLQTTQPETTLDGNIASWVIEAPPDNFMKLALATTGDDGNTFDAIVLAWCPLPDGADIVWVGHCLVELLGCTTGTQAGVGSGTLGTAVKFVDHIADMIDHTHNQSAELIGGVDGGGGVPFVQFDYSGLPLIEVRVARSNGTLAENEEIGGMWSTV